MLVSAEHVGPLTREERGVGRERPGGRGDRPLKAYSFPRPPLKIGRRLSAMAVEAQAFGADRVHHDQEYVRRTDRRSWKPGAGAVVRPGVPSGRGDGCSGDGAE